MQRRHLSRAAWLGMFLASVLGVQTLWAQDYPAARLQWIYPPGAQVGSTVEISVGGEDLEGADQLVFSHPGLKAQVLTRPPQPWESGPQPVYGRFRLTVDAKVPPGVYEVQARGRYGLSNPRLFHISPLAQVEEKEPNSTQEQAMQVSWPVIINGRINGGTDVDWFRFQAKKGERILIDCWARRIDSQLDGTLVVLNSRGQEIAYDRDTNDLDPLIDLIVPEDGEYFVKLYDFTYGGGVNYFYRLRISAAPQIDFVLPPSLPPGQKVQLTLFGRNLPGGQNSGFKYRGRPLQKLVVSLQVPTVEQALNAPVAQAILPVAGFADFFWYRLSTPSGLSNPVPVALATAPGVAEQEPNDQPQQAQKVQVPCELVGQFQRVRDVDWFTFQANAGEVYYIEACSHRLGWGADLYLRLEQIIQGKNGTQVRVLAELDDAGLASDTRFMPLRSDDPIYRFAVPATGTYRLVVRDLYYRSDPRLVYRVAIRPPQPDFRLVVLPRFPTLNRDFNDRYNLMLMPGETEVLEVFAHRRDGFAEEIRVRVEGLPPGVRCEELILGPEQTRGQLVLVAKEDVKPWTGPIRVVGQAQVGSKSLVRPARTATIVWRSPQQNTAATIRLSSGLHLAIVSGPPVPVQMVVAQRQWETYRGARLEVPIRVLRREGGKNNITVQPGVYGVPPRFRVNTITIQGNQNEGKVQINLPTNAPLGTYTLTLFANTQVSVELKKDLVAETQQKIKAVEQKIQQWNQEVKNLNQKIKDLSAKQKQLQQQIGKEPKNENLKKQKAQVDQQLNQTKQQLQQLTNQVKAAQNALNQLRRQLAARQRTARRRNINYYAPVPSLIFKVAPSPVKVSLTPLQVKQGEKADLVVKIERLFGFNGRVDIQWRALSGVRINNLTFQPNQKEQKATVTVAPNAPVGKHALRAVVRIATPNGTLQQNAQGELEVQKAPPPKK